MNRIIQTILLMTILFIVSIMAYQVNYIYEIYKGTNPDFETVESNI